MEILNNWVSGVAWAEGIGVIDNAREVTGQTMIDAVISGNTVDLNDTYYNAIVAAAPAVERSSTTRSRVTARMGVAVHADRWLVAGNDVSGFEADLADVWLTSESSRNTVRCATPADVVLDEGTRNNVRGCSLLEIATAGAMESGSALPFTTAVDGAFAIVRRVRRSC